MSGTAHNRETAPSASNPVRVAALATRLSPRIDVGTSNRFRCREKIIAIRETGVTIGAKIK